MSVFEEFDAMRCVKPHKQASQLLNMECWVLTESFTYHLDLGTSNLYVVVPYGYIVTESALPVAFKKILKSTGKYGQARVLHSYLCENAKITNGKTYYTITRERCDGVLLQALDGLNINKYVRRLVHTGVGMFRMLARPPLPVVNEIKHEIEEYIRLNNFNTGSYELTEAQVKDITKRYKLK